jgi:hypothetical protein
LRPDDPRASGTEIQWRRAVADAWQSRTVRGSRVRIDALPDHQAHEFRVRTLSTGSRSVWSETRTAAPGAVEGLGITSGVKGLTLGLMLETAWYGLLHALRSP